MYRIWTVLRDKHDMWVLVSRAKLSTLIYSVLVESPFYWNTSNTWRGQWLLLRHFVQREIWWFIFPLTLLHALTHTMFVAQKNNFLVISALLWVVINFSSFHNGLRVWAKKFDLLSKIYQFISPAICLFMFWLLCFFVPFDVRTSIASSRLIWSSVIMFLCTYLATI